MRPRREEIRKNAYTYFVSTQTQDRRPFFRHERWARLLTATLDHYADTHYTLHAYVIMPDHLHLLIMPATTIEKSIQMIKGGFSFRARKEFAWNGAIWQEGFTDHRIRDEEDWRQHLEYIRQNPVRARLTSESVLYPYMNFQNQEFPQGLKPDSAIGGDVRAEARTLHAKHQAADVTGEGSSLAKGEHSGAAMGGYQTSASGAPVNETSFSPLEDAREVKGTGFSPSANGTFGRRALAPEGRQR